MGIDYCSHGHSGTLKCLLRDISRGVKEGMKTEKIPSLALNCKLPVDCSSHFPSVI